ncbi:MAG: hypothetical protein GY866_36310 [Proteobacteria bacterium]|nr:hypothetical protein [Pseudomonadota bacterium]
MESDSRRAISIQLNELTHVSREGKDFLREIRDQVTFVGIPEFLRLEVCPGHNLDTLEQGLEKNT